MSSFRKLSLFELLEQKRLLAGDVVGFDPAACEAGPAEPGNGDAVHMDLEHSQEFEWEVALAGEGPESGKAEVEIECEGGNTTIEVEVEIGMQV